MPDNKEEHSNQRLRVAVFGFYGNENLGDESIVEAVTANLHSLMPNAKLNCISVNPIDSAKRHKIDADPIFLPLSSYQSQRDRMQKEKFCGDQSPSEYAQSTKSYREVIKSYFLVRAALSLVRTALTVPAAIRYHRQHSLHVQKIVDRTDAIIISGSNQFLDNFGGPFAFPYMLWQWTRIASLENRPILIVSVGAGPITSQLSKWFIRTAIRRARFVTFRDAGSIKLLGLNSSESQVRPDLAFSHRSNFVDVALKRDRQLENIPVVALNPMAVHAQGYWHEPNDDKYSIYVKRLTEVVTGFQDSGMEYILVANQPRDELVISDVIDACVANGVSRMSIESKFYSSNTVAEYLHNLSKADIVVATRFHAIVLALLLARPVVGLCYYRKSAELLAEFSLGQYALDVDKFSPEQVHRGIQNLADHYDEIFSDISARVRMYRECLDEQYIEVSRILNGINRDADPPAGASMRS